MSLEVNEQVDDPVSVWKAAKSSVHWPKLENIREVEDHVSDAVREVYGEEH